MINTEDTFFDKQLPQKVSGGLDEVCRFCDEFSFLCKKGNFFKFQLQFKMSLSTWDRNLLSYVKSAMTTRLQFDISFLIWHNMLSLFLLHMFVKKLGQGTVKD